jgi:hypothetical protein
MHRRESPDRTEEMKGIVKIALAFVFGLSLGSGVLWWHFRNVYTSLVLETPYTRIVDSVTTLTHLRRESYADLSEEKERELSGDIYALSIAQPVKSLTEKQRSYLLMAARYRAEHPFKTGDSEIDEAAQRFLSEASMLSFR